MTAAHRLADRLVLCCLLCWPFICLLQSQHGQEAACIPWRQLHALLAEGPEQAVAADRPRSIGAGRSVQSGQKRRQVNASRRGGSGALGDLLSCLRLAGGMLALLVGSSCNLTDGAPQLGHGQFDREHQRSRYGLGTGPTSIRGVLSTGRLAAG
jgi:hypothetical protein